MSTIDEKLQQYRERKREIESLESQLKLKVQSHETQTRIDFGIADGDVVSVQNLVTTISMLMNSKPNKGD